MIQIMKIKLTRGKTFPVWGSMDVTVNDLLLVRTKDGTKYFIQVLNRQTGGVINQIQSVCNHNKVRINKYPRHPDHVFECCSICEEIRIYNINATESFLLHKQRMSPKIIRMCDGSAGCLLVSDTDGALLKLDWNKEKHDAQMQYIREVSPGIKLLLRLCYVECNDILVCTVKVEKDNRDYEILAQKLEDGTVMWSLYGPVNGRTVKPDSITCDAEGNAYVNDRGNDRILKINSLTGEVLSILLFEKEMTIHSMRWSNTEPNLTLLEGNEISIFSVEYFI